jgi:hypothetical protein
MQDIIKIEDLQISKALAETIRKELSQRVLDGEISAVQVQAAIKFYEKVFNGDDKKDNGLVHVIKPYVVDEIEKDKHRKDWFGYQVSVGEAGARYSFENCNDPELAELEEQERDLKEKIKDRQNFLKSLKGGMDIIWNGEGVTVFPPVKYSTTSAKFTLK